MSGQLASGVVESTTCMPASANFFRASCLPNWGEPIAPLASPDDAYAVVGAVAELASRQIRLGVPSDVRDLEPVIERLMLGVMARSDGS